MKKLVTMLFALLLITTCSFAFTACTTKYTVKFDTGTGGSTVASQTVEKGKKATRPATDPTRTGFDFDDWYVSTDEDAEPFDFENTEIKANTTIYAKWTEAEVTFTVTFNTDGGSAVAVQNVAEGGKATRPTTNPTKSGFDFDDWYVSNEAGAAKFDFDTTITANTTIYAKWTALKTVASIRMIDGTQGWEGENNEYVITDPQVGDILYAEIVLSDGTVIRAGEGDLNDGITYRWYYVDNDQTLGTTAIYTYTSDNDGKAIAVEVTITDVAGIANYPA